jgi:hypothetical protein
LKAASEAQNPSMETTHFDQKTGSFNLGERKGIGFWKAWDLSKQKRAENNAFVVLVL